MPQKAKYIAERASDDFYQNFSTPTDFFTRDDFLVRVGSVAADYYQKEWKRMYDELRAERITEIVGFDAGFLSEQFVKVKKENNTWIGNIVKQAVSFPYDMQNSGYQLVFDVKTGKEIERSNAHETWQDEYLPFNSKLFFYIDRNQIKITTKGNCNIQEVRILYVPSIKIGDGEEELPDGIIGYCVGATVEYMRQMAGRPVKKSLDGNQNESVQTEMNKEQLK